MKKFITLAEGLMQPLYSLYIHWPFCSSKCYYCDFVALESHEDFQLAYHEALMREIAAYAAALEPQDRKIKTIFIGGGTPSLYPLDKLEELFVLLKHSFDWSGIEEVTLEANPADITEERLDTWRHVGINRISCGVQVLDDQVLFSLNRRQRTRDVLNALKLLPKYFDNISMDLILGLPGVSAGAWQTTLDTLMAAPIQHISMYFLMVHEKTPLYYKIARGEMVLDEEERVLQLYQQTVQRFAASGFEQYEISNFARPGYASKHNQAYWDRQPYRGFGIGAASFDGAARRVNEKNLTNYLEQLGSGMDSGHTIEILTPDQERLEAIMLGLRTTAGMDLHAMLYYINAPEHEAFRERLQALEAAGLVVVQGGKVALTQRGMVLENEVVLRLI